MIILIEIMISGEFESSQSWLSWSKWLLISGISHSSEQMLSPLTEDHHHDCHQRRRHRHHHRNHRINYANNIIIKVIIVMISGTSQSSEQMLAPLMEELVAEDWGFFILHLPPWTTVVWWVSNVCWFVWSVSGQCLVSGDVSSKFLACLIGSPNHQWRRPP